MPKHWRLTGSALSSRVCQWTQRSIVKSIQRGTIAITGATTGTLTITAVNTSNARIRFLGCSANLNVVDGTKYFARIDLTNSTTITATVNASPGANTLTVGVEVTEYWPGVIKSIQRGTVTVTGAANTATITTVNTAKTEFDYLGFSDTDTSNNNGVIPYAVLTNATTVTATNVVAVAATIGFQAVEFY